MALFLAPHSFVGQEAVDKMQQKLDDLQREITEVTEQNQDAAGGCALWSYPTLYIYPIKP